MNRVILPDGSSVVSYETGDEYWFSSPTDIGNFDVVLPHRPDGPAKITPKGAEFWYRNGKLHRTDGPAVIFPGGEEYWHNDD